MKKSDMYYLAQLAVIKDPALSDKEKRAIVVELEDKRGVAVYLEREDVKAAHREKKEKR